MPGLAHMNAEYALAVQRRLIPGLRQKTGLLGYYKAPGFNDHLDPSLRYLRTRTLMGDPCGLAVRIQLSKDASWMSVYTGSEMGTQ